MQRKNALLALAALLAAIGLAVPAGASTTYHFGVSDQRTNITFQSETDFETILGSTHQLSGVAQADFTEGTAHVELVVPVASLNTGIDLRDGHLRSPMWLDAGKHPEITFISTEAKKAGKNRWKVKGTFSMHGVSQELTTIVEVREIPADLAKKAGLEKGDWIRVSIPFQIKLSDFGVKIPQMAAAKVNDTWDVKILAYASTASTQLAENPRNPCNPCGGERSMKAANPTNPCGR